MEDSFSTKAIILKREAYKEVDSKVWLYTLSSGKLELVARGTARAGSKLAGHIEPLNAIDALILKGRQRNYLASAINYKAFSVLKSDLSKLSLAGKSLKTFFSVVRPGQFEPELFFFLEDYLSFLNQNDFILEEGEIAFWEKVFLLKLASVLGYQPELRNCLDCKKVLSSEQEEYFLPWRGGFLCPSCLLSSELRAEGFKLSAKFRLLASLILDSDWGSLKGLKAPLNSKQEFSRAINSFFEGLRLA